MEEDEGDPFEGMNNAQIAEIYNKMKPEDRRLFRQFKSFHKLYYNLHRHDAPSHHLARGIVSQIFSGLPARDAETIANAWAELLAAERLKELCKQLGLAIPAELQMYQPPLRHQSTHHLPSLQDFHRGKRRRDKRLSHSHPWRRVLHPPNSTSSQT